jgi:NAD+ synthase (glutamine-hydrolysing)
VGSLRPVLDEDSSLLQALVLGTRDYARRCGFKTALIGLSGGIDSAVVACIAAEALGPQNVHGVALPSRYSSEGSRTDAKELADNLGLKFSEIPIEGPFAAFLSTLAPHFEGRAPDVTEENLQARLRGTTLMALSNKFGALLLTTGNKSEIAMGYCTLYGDMCGGLSVISDVFKLRVYALARRINRDREVIPLSTIEKPPSAELRPDQKDEDSLPPYNVLDPLLQAHIEGEMDADALVKAGFAAPVVHDILRKVRIAEYKRWQMAPGLKVTTKAFGTGRRFPIAKA